MSKLKYIIFFTLALLFLYVGFLIGEEIGKYHIRNDSQPFKIPGSNENNLKEKQKEEIQLTLGKIATPSIEIDEETRLHLEEFRYRAGKLKEKFPDTFYTSAPTTDKKIALTFDDGPDQKTTPEIIEILGEHKIPATFFVTGENADRFPIILEKALAAGHQVGNHTWSHPRPLSLTVSELLAELTLTEKVLSKNHLQKTKYFRPPYGLLSDEQMEQLKTKGYKVICWSVDSMDWYTSDPEEIKKCVLDSVHPGAIILMHSAGGKNNRIGTIKALPDIVNELVKQGYEFTTIGQLLGSD